MHTEISIKSCHYPTTMLKSLLIPILALVPLISAYPAPGDNTNDIIRFTEPKPFNSWEVGNNYTVRWTTDLSGKELDSTIGELKLFQHLGEGLTQTSYLGHEIPISKGSIEVTATQDLNSGPYILILTTNYTVNGGRVVASTPVKIIP
ncbi:hypothetical protein BDF14DRAFT_1996585 [Spinellus fusiger]|nr:hypothetical protein BDF14DRAFT_1996585 [Spinellus fusiger]